MPTLNYAVSLSGGGSSINRSVPRTADGVASREVTLPVGKAGTLTTRTDDNTGTATLSGGHGITTGMNVDIHWSGGVQYDVTVGTVSVNSVPFDLGIGDVLPIATTAIAMTPRVQINADIDGDALAILGIEAGYASSSSTAAAHVEFQDVANDSLAELDLVANVPRVYDVTGGASNPFTGDVITKLFASNGSSSEAATLKLLWASDSTP